MAHRGGSGSSGTGSSSSGFGSSSTGAGEADLASHTFRQANPASGRRPHNAQHQQWDQKEQHSTAGHGSLARQFAALQAQGESQQQQMSARPAPPRTGVWMSEQGGVVLASSSATGSASAGRKGRASRVSHNSNSNVAVASIDPSVFLPPVVGATVPPPNLMRWVRSLARVDAAGVRGQHSADMQHAQLAAHHQQQLASTFPSAEQLSLFFAAHQAEQRALADHQQHQAAARAAQSQSAENVTLSQTWGGAGIGSAIKASVPASPGLQSTPATNNQPSHGQFTTTANLSRQPSQNQFALATGGTLSRQPSQGQFTPQPPSAPAPQPSSHTSSRASLLDASASHSTSSGALNYSPSSDVLLVLKSKSLAQRRQAEMEARELEDERLAREAQESPREPEDPNRLIVLKAPSSKAEPQQRVEKDQQQPLAEEKPAQETVLDFGFLVSPSQGTLHQTLRPSLDQAVDTAPLSSTYPHSSAAVSETVALPPTNAETSRIAMDLDLATTTSKASKKMPGSKVSLTMSTRDLPRDKNVVLTLHRRVGNRALGGSGGFGASSGQYGDDSAWEYVGCTEMLLGGTTEDSTTTTAGSLEFERTFLLDAPVSNPDSSSSSSDPADAELQALARKQHRGLPIGLASSSREEAPIILKVQALHVLPVAAGSPELPHGLQPSDTHLMAQLTTDASHSTALPQAEVLGEIFFLLAGVMGLPEQEFKLQPVPLTPAQMMQLRRKDAGRFNANASSVVAALAPPPVQGCILVTARDLGPLVPVALSLAALNLPASEWLKKTDGLIVVYARNHLGRFSWLGQTARLRANTSPIFEEPLLLNSFAKGSRDLRFAIYDSHLVAPNTKDGSKDSAAPLPYGPPRNVRYLERDLLGEVYVKLDELLAAQDAMMVNPPPVAEDGAQPTEEEATPSLTFRLLKRGQIVRVRGADSVLQIRAQRVVAPLEEVDTMASSASGDDQGPVVHLSIECTGLPLLTTTGKCDPLVSLFGPAPNGELGLPIATSTTATTWRVLGQTERLVHTSSPVFRRVLHARLPSLTSEASEAPRDLRLAVYDTHETDHVRYHSSVVSSGPQEYLLPEARLLGEHLFDLKLLVAHAQAQAAAGEPTVMRLDLARHGRVVLAKGSSSASLETDEHTPAQFVVRVLNLDQLPRVVPEPEPEPLVEAPKAEQAPEAEPTTLSSQEDSKPAGPSQIALSMSCRGLESSERAHVQQYVCVLSLGSVSNGNAATTFEVLGQTERQDGSTDAVLSWNSVLFLAKSVALGAAAADPASGTNSERNLKLAVYGVELGDPDDLTKQLLGEAMLPLSSLLFHTRQDVRLSFGSGSDVHESGVVTLHSVEIGSMTRAFLSLAAVGLPTVGVDGQGRSCSPRAHFLVHQSFRGAYVLEGMTEIVKEGLLASSSKPIFKRGVELDIYALQDRALRVALYDEGDNVPEASLLGECFINLRQLQAQVALRSASLRAHEALVAAALASGTEVPSMEEDICPGLFVQLSDHSGDEERPAMIGPALTPSLCADAPTDPIMHATEIYVQLWTNEAEYLTSLEKESAPFARAPAPRAAGPGGVPEEAWQTVATFLAAPSTKLFEHITTGIPVTAHDLALLLAACKGSLLRLMDHLEKFNMAARRFDAPLRSLVPAIHLAAASNVHVGPTGVARVVTAVKELGTLLDSEVVPTALQVDRGITASRGLEELLEHLKTFAGVQRRFDSWETLLPAITEARTSGSHVPLGVRVAVRAYLGHPSTRLFRSGAVVTPEAFLEVPMLPSEVDQLVVACEGFEALLQRLQRFGKEGRNFATIAQVVTAIREPAAAPVVAAVEPPVVSEAPIAEAGNADAPVTEAAAVASSAAVEPVVEPAVAAAAVADDVPAPAPAPVAVPSMAPPPLVDTSDVPNVAWQQVFRFLTSPKTKLFPKIAREEASSSAAASSESAPVTGANAPSSGLHVSPAQIEELLVASDGVQGLMTRLRQLNSDGVQFKSFSALTVAMRDVPHRGRSSETERRVILGFLMEARLLPSGFAFAAVPTVEVDELLHAGGDLISLLDSLVKLDAESVCVESVAQLAQAIKAKRTSAQEAKQAQLLGVMSLGNAASSSPVTITRKNFTEANPPRVSDEVYEAIIAHVTRPGLKLFAPSSTGLSLTRAVADRLVYVAGGLEPLLGHLDLFSLCARHLEGFAAVLPALLSVADKQTHLAPADVSLLVEALNTSRLFTQETTVDSIPGETLDALVIQATGVAQLLAHVRAYARVGRSFASMSELLSTLRQTQLVEDGSHLSPDVRAALWAALYPSAPPAARVPLIAPGFTLNGSDLDEVFVAGGSLDGVLIDLPRINNIQVANITDLLEAMRRAREGLQQQQVPDLEAPRPKTPEAAPVVPESQVVVAAVELTSEAPVNAASEAAPIVTDAPAAIETNESAPVVAASAQATQLSAEAKAELGTYFTQPTAQALFPALAASVTPDDLFTGLGVSDGEALRGVLAGGGSVVELLVHFQVFASIGRTFASWEEMIKALQECEETGSHVSESARDTLLEFLSSEHCALFDVAATTDGAAADLHIDSGGIDTLVASGGGLTGTLQHLQVLDACGRRVTTFAELAPAIDLARRTGSHVRDEDQQALRTLLQASALFSSPLTSESLAAISGPEFDRLFSCSGKAGVPGIASHLERFVLAGRSGEFVSPSDLLVALDLVVSGESHVTEGARETLIGFLSEHADTIFDASVSGEAELTQEDLDALIFATAGQGLTAAIEHMRAFIAIGRTFDHIASLIGAVQAAHTSGCHLGEPELQALGQALSRADSRLLAPALKPTACLAGSVLDDLVRAAHGFSALLVKVAELEASAPQAESLEQLVTLVQAIVATATVTAVAAATAPA